jgi:hypothetical protein
MLTLTLLSSDDPLPNQVKRIKEAFRRLRAGAVWKQCVKGGYWVLELTYNSETHQWHPHIHAVIDCKYLPIDWVRERWHKITGDSMVVHITKIDAARSTYIAKYIGKGHNSIDDSQRLWAYYEAQHRQRDVQSFGRVPPISGDPDRPRGECIYVGTVSNIISAAQAGMHWAIIQLPILHEALSRALITRSTPTSAFASSS